MIVLDRTELRRVTEVAVAAARGAGQIALEGFRKRDLAVELKADFHDIVTKYDKACEDYIRAEILREFPDSTVVGEEAGASGHGSLTWYIDPIDGTANYARGTALWAVSIAAAVDGQIVTGVVFDPVADHVFWADERGAFLDEEPMESWGFADPAQATVIANFPLPRDLVHFPDLALEQFAELINSYSSLRALGSSAVSLCWVAAGWVDATFSFGVSAWDVAAASFILRKAGGRYITYSGGEAMPDSGDYHNPHYLGMAPSGDYELLHRIVREQSKRPLS